MPVSWNSKEGKERLFQSHYANDFYTLAHLFERQIKPTYCDIASAVMVLNALRLRKTGLMLETKLDVNLSGHQKLPFNCYTQLTFLDGDAGRYKPRKKVEGKTEDAADCGYTMDELYTILRRHLLGVTMVKAKEPGAKTLEKFRHDLMAYLNESGTFIIANFDSKPVDRTGGGHFSPIAAYHPPSDSCLVMDVAGHKNPWFWAPLANLYKAMNTMDKGEYRGYLVISDKLDR